MSAVDQRIKQHLREKEAAFGLAPVRSLRPPTARLEPVQLPPPLAAGRTLRVGSNLLIAVGLLILIYVVGYQGYYYWLENSTPSNVVLAGAPTTTYLSASGLATATPAPVNAADQPTTVAQAAAATPTPIAVASNFPLSPLNSAAPAAPAAPAVTSRVRRVAAPSIALDASVIDVGWHASKDKKSGAEIMIWDVAEFAAGHHQGSANPGQVGNIVLSGHDDWKGEVFKNLEHLKPGDEITVYNEEGTAYLYVVTQMERVREENVPLEERIRNAEYMNQTADQTLTLITCWPYKVDTHRLIVIAKPYDVIRQTTAFKTNSPAGPNLR